MMDTLMSAIGIFEWFTSGLTHRIASLPCVASPDAEGLARIPLGLVLIVRAANRLCSLGHQTRTVSQWLPHPLRKHCLDHTTSGRFLNTFLFGILVLQIINYYQAFKKDKLWLRCLVLYLLVVETLNTAMTVVMIYEPLVSQFGTSSPVFLFPSLLPSRKSLPEQGVQNTIIQYL
ncbi:hypothetical protein MVEN_01733000 [Mycena venus]|uniref:Uncharacterized protein n=1 Tax=Mycena venus TaxID=2733690 RepID=A0A8H6XKQ6_9AGAR|nr:hypothetical protein MVEN_01733000 [Mycena venus]